jgi:hypothetical protein
MRLRNLITSLPNPNLLLNGQVESESEKTGSDPHHWLKENKITQVNLRLCLHRLLDPWAKEPSSDVWSDKRPDQGAAKFPCVQHLGASLSEKDIGL